MGLKALRKLGEVRITAGLGGGGGGVTVDGHEFCRLFHPQADEVFSGRHTHFVPEEVGEVTSVQTETLGQLFHGEFLCVFRLHTVEGLCNIVPFGYRIGL